MLENVLARNSIKTTLKKDNFFLTLMSNKKEDEKNINNDKKTFSQESCNIVLLSTMVQRGLIAEKKFHSSEIQSKREKAKNETHLLELNIVFNCLLFHK